MRLSERYCGQRGDRSSSEAAAEHAALFIG